MDSKKKIGLAIGTVVIGIGSALGVAGLASATGTHATTSSQVQVAPNAQSGTAQQGVQVGSQGQLPPDGGQAAGDRQGGPVGLATELATQLNADQATVQGVLDEVFGANQPSQGGSLDRDAMDAKISTALAAKLGVTEAKVQAAFDAIHANQPQGGPMEGQSAPGATGTNAGSTQGGTTTNG